MDLKLETVLTFASSEMLKSKRNNPTNMVLREEGRQRQITLVSEIHAQNNSWCAVFLRGSRKAQKRSVDAVGQ